MIVPQDSAQVDSTSVENIIAKSKANMQIADICFKKSDSATERVVKEKIYDRKMLKALAVFSKQRIIIKTDTVFIETEKSFWGRKKSKVTKVEGDSSILTVDSVEIDTIQ
jgi:hypothetical protein